MSITRKHRMGSWRKGGRKAFPMNSQPAECSNCKKLTTKAQTVGVQIGRSHHKTRESIPKDVRVYGWDVFKRVCKNNCKG